MDVYIDWQYPGTYLVFFFYAVIVPASLYWAFFIDHHRSKPDNYVGKFQRPDGSIVHVARMPSGELWACTDEPPGVMPKPIGYVSGREVIQWHKLSSTPDGKDRVPRPD